MGRGRGRPSRAGGASYLFQAIKGSWRQEAEFAPKDAKPGDAFGRWVALSTVRKYVFAAVGSPLHDAGVGGAYVYEI